MSQQTVIVSASTTVSLPTNLLAPDGQGVVQCLMNGAASSTPSSGLGHVGQGMKIGFNFPAPPGQTLTCSVGTRDGTQGQHHGGAAGGGNAGAGGGSTGISTPAGVAGLDPLLISLVGTAGAYWPFEDASGTSIADVANGHNMTATSVALGQPSIVPSDSFTSAAFTGSSRAIAAWTPTFSTGATIGGFLMWSAVPTIAEQFLTGLNTTTFLGGQLKISGTSPNTGKFAAVFGNGTNTATATGVWIPTANHIYFVVASYGANTITLNAWDLTTWAGAAPGGQGSMATATATLTGTSVTTGSAGWIVGNNDTTATLGRMFVAPGVLTLTQLTSVANAALASAPALLCEAAGGGGPGAAAPGLVGGPGGAGGWTGFNGGPGQNTGGTGSTPGGGGLGATPAVQGAGGTAGSGTPAGVAGHAGVAGVGGAGGIGAAQAWAGGGGGGGYAGGGGGGGGGQPGSQSGGGGGGGASWLSPSATNVTTALAAGAGSIRLTYRIVDPPFPPLLLVPLDQARVDLTAPTFEFAYEPGTDSGTLDSITFAASEDGGTFLWWDPVAGAWTSTLTWIPVTSLGSFGGNLYSLSFPVGAFVNGHTYQWRVNTRESYYQTAGTVAYSFVTGAPQPTVTITAPVAAVTSPQFSVSWSEVLTSSNVQTSYRIIVYSLAQATAPAFVAGAGPNIFDTGVVASANTGAVVTPSPLVNGEGFVVAVQITQTGGAASNWTVSPPVFAEWAGPPVPSLTALATNDVNTGQPIVELDFTAQMNLLTATDSSLEIFAGTGNWASTSGTTLSLGTGWSAGTGACLTATTAAAASVVVSLPSGLYPASFGTAYALTAVAQAPASRAVVTLSAAFYDPFNVLLSVVPVAFSFDSFSGVLLAGVATAPAGTAYIAMQLSYSTSGSGEVHQFDNLGVFASPVIVPWSIGGWATTGITAELAYSDDAGNTWYDVLGASAVPASIQGSNISGVAFDYTVIPSSTRIYAVQLSGVSPLAGGLLPAGTVTSSGWAESASVTTTTNSRWFLADPATPGSAVAFDSAANPAPNFHEKETRVYVAGADYSTKMTDGTVGYDLRLSARVTSRPARDSFLRLLGALPSVPAPPVLYVQSPDYAWWMTLEGDRGGQIALGTIDPAVSMEHFDFTLDLLAAAPGTGSPFAIPTVTSGPPSAGGGGAGFAIESFGFADSTTFTLIALHHKFSSAAETFGFADAAAVTSFVAAPALDTANVNIVQTANAGFYFPMEDTAGTTSLVDIGGFNHVMTAASGVTLGAATVSLSDTRTSAAFVAGGSASTSFAPTWANASFGINFAFSTLPTANQQIFTNQNGFTLRATVSGGSVFVSLIAGATTITSTTALVAGHVYAAYTVWAASGTNNLSLYVFDVTAQSGGLAGHVTLAYAFSPLGFTVGGGLVGRAGRFLGAATALTLAQVTALAQAAYAPAVSGNPLLGVSYESTAAYNSKATAYGKIPLGLCYFDSSIESTLTSTAWTATKLAPAISSGNGVMFTFKVDPTGASASPPTGAVVTQAAQLKGFFQAAPKTAGPIYYAYYAEPENDVAAGRFTLKDFLAAWDIIIGYANTANNPQLIATSKLVGFDLASSSSDKGNWLQWVPQPGITTTHAVACVCFDIYPPHPSTLTNCGCTPVPSGANGGCTNGVGTSAPINWLAQVVTAMTGSAATGYNSGAGLRWGIGEFGTVGDPVFGTSSTGQQTVTRYSLSKRPSWLTSVADYIQGLGVTPMPDFVTLYDSAVLGGLGVADCFQSPAGFGVWSGGSSGAAFDSLSVAAWKAAIAKYNP